MMQMRDAAYELPTGQCGIQILLENESQIPPVSEWFRSHFERMGLAEAQLATQVDPSAGPSIQIQFRDEVASEWAPGGNTALLRPRLNHGTPGRDRDLDDEILLAMLLSPIPFDFPSHQELISTIRIRRTIVQAAGRTAVAFATTKADRPPDYWHYDEDRGFLLLPGKSLITALEKSTNSGESETLYTFSCRRATEYLLLLGLTREAMTCNPPLFVQLHHQAETRALKGWEFERTFVRTIGSMENPLPLRYFVPGDRTWFRNVDPMSADVTGFEGSWTIYLGGGLFADFWRRDRVFTLETKLASMYHWRNATYQDADGELQIDEAHVEELVAETCRTPGALERILQEAMRLQVPLGTDGGGCIEPHREHPCWVRPETTDVVLPDVV